jgi:hypothetical protein
LFVSIVNDDENDDDDEADDIVLDGDEELGIFE